LLASLLPPLMHDRSIALVLQNGLHVEQSTREVVGPGRVAGGCCFLEQNWSRSYPSSRLWKNLDGTLPRNG
jgi:ketopantoate reductase